MGIILSALVLTALSIFFVASWARLSYHRNTYLAIGAVGLALVATQAKPFVQRTHDLDVAAGCGGAALFITIAQSGLHGIPREWAVKARNDVYEKNSDFLEGLFPESPSRICILGACQLLLAAGLGLWIGTGIDQVSHLIPIVIVAGLADIWSVSAGATAVIIKSSTIHYFLLRFPLLSGGSGEIPPLIGLTDFLFFGIFFQAAVRFGLGTVKNLLLLGSSFLMTVLIAVLAGVGLPVLPFMGAFFVAGNFRKLILKAEELLQIAVFLGAVILSYLVFTRLLRPS